MTRKSVAPVFLDAEAVRERLSAIDVMAAVRDAFLELAAGTGTASTQTVIEFAGGGDAIVYPGALERRGLMAVKVSPYLPGRSPAVTAWTLLVSLESGAPVLLCDALALTTERTAATTALAVDALAPADARCLAVIGCGPIGRAHLRYVTPLRPFDDIRVYSARLAAGDPIRTAELAACTPDARAAGSAAEAVADADVVLLCTSSSTPVVELADLRDDALVTSTVTSSLAACEIDAGAVPHMAVYCDARSAAPVAAGELRAAAASGWSTDRIVADLAELVAGTAPARPGGRAFFRSVGLGVEDAAAAAALHDALGAPSSDGGPAGA
ncbi:MAG: ornithine cyclodeaminase family protein [Thermoleophilia bacterium]|nr:ornithine cyclodeaminase family protein [Thermoleophilia bacterium]